MNGRHLYIVGAGGHAAVVADALLAAGSEVLGFLDADSARHGSRICGLPVLGDDGFLEQHSVNLVRLANGLGGSRGEGLRRAVQQRLEARGWQFVGVRHPSATVSPFATLGAGTQLLAQCVVQAGAVVGNGCIINSAAVVEHDVTLGAFVHVSCNATLCGGVRVDEDSHIGAAAVVRQGIHLGAKTVVGAGAVVVNDSAGGATLVGVPAMPMKKRSP